MPGNTVELNLKTAVDSDDNADYLTISLAQSLQTVDALFNNTSGHNHSGAHQGGPLGAGSIPGSALVDGSISSAKIADGGVATVDLADRAATNVKLGTDTARANLLVNGSFDVWQRGNGPFSGNGTWTADRWVTNLSGASTLSVSKDSANADVGSSFCASCSYTHASPSVFQQPIDGYAALRGKTVSFSARVRTSVPGAVAVRLTTTGTGGSSQLGSAHSGGGTYETLSISAAIGALVTGLTVEIYLTTTCSFFVDNAMLVVGAVPADYQPMHFADDVVRCMRYYEIQGNAGVNEVLATGQANTTTVAHFPIRFKVRKAVTPTVTIGASGDGLRATAANGGPLAGSSQSCSDSTVDGTRLVWTGATAGLVVGNASLLFTNTASGTVIAEANP